MKSLLIAVAAALSIALPAHAQDAAEWKEYRFPEQGFAVSGPIEPEVEEAAATGGEQGKIVRFASAQTIFMVGVMKVPEGVNPDPQDVLKGSLVGTMQPVKGQTTSVRSITLEGVPGIDAEFEAPEIHGHYRAYYSGKTLYQLSSLSPRSVPVDEDTLKWLVSFRLLK